MLVIACGLLLVVCVAAYLLVTNRLEASVARLAAGEVSREAVTAEASRLLAILLGAALLIVLFAVGAYLFIGLGRAVSRPAVDKKPTEYFDAWSHYRVSEEQIRAATEEEPHDAGDDEGGEALDEGPERDNP